MTDHPGSAEPVDDQFAHYTEHLYDAPDYASFYQRPFGGFDGGPAPVAAPTHHDAGWSGQQSPSAPQDGLGVASDAPLFVPPAVEDGSATVEGVVPSTQRTPEAWSRPGSEPVAPASAPATPDAFWSRDGLPTASSGVVPPSWRTDAYDASPEGVVQEPMGVPAEAPGHTAPPRPAGPPPITTAGIGRLPASASAGRQDPLERLAGPDSPFRLAESAAGRPLHPAHLDQPVTGRTPATRSGVPSDFDWSYGGKFPVEKMSPNQLHVGSESFPAEFAALPQWDHQRPRRQIRDSDFALDDVISRSRSSVTFAGDLFRLTPTGIALRTASINWGIAGYALGTFLMLPWWIVVLLVVKAPMPQGLWVDAGLCLIAGVYCLNALLRFLSFRRYAMWAAAVANAVLASGQAPSGTNTSGTNTSGTNNAISPNPSTPAPPASSQ